MKKYILLFASALLVLIILPNFLFAQIKNDNTLSVKVNGKEWNTKPRRVHIGRTIYYTGNSEKPETMLRIWLISKDGKPAVKEGNYLVVNSANPPKKKKEKKYFKDENIENFEGIAGFRYVVETKPPRMRFHVGDSGNKGKVIKVTNTGNGYLKIQFKDLELNGTYWKERVTATVFGGVGRLEDKMKDKAITKTTGYDWNIDPEGNGYKKTRKSHIIKITDGTMIIKLEH